MKISKLILKRIIKEEILREAYGREELTQIRHLASPPGNKRLSNALKAYRLVASIEDANMKSLAQDYFMKQFGKDAFEKVERLINHNPESKEILDLSGVDLSGGELSGVNLSRANLSGANLSGANLSGAYLRSATLNGANLSGASLTGADLINCFLFETDLTGADLTNSFMTNVRLDKTNFTNANLANVRLLPFASGDLAGSIFKGAKWNSKTMINNFWFGSTYVRPQAARFRDENELVQTDEVGPMGAPDDAVLLSDL